MQNNAERFSITEERLRIAERDFRQAQANLTAAQTYAGTGAAGTRTVNDAKTALAFAGECYSNNLTYHAESVRDLYKERTK